MEYNVYDFPEECKLILQNFENDIKDKIISFIKPNVEWKCTMRMSLNKREKDMDSSQFISNPSLSFKDSYEVFNKTKSFFDSRVKVIEPYIAPQHSLALELKFIELTPEEKERKFKNKGNKSTDSTTKPDDKDETSFIPQKPLYTFSRVILSDKIKSEILSAINILKYQDLIYNRWGFNQVDPVPKSVLNFYGPPGTGKTMSAHAVAHELNKPLLALNYAEIESKYVGEAPKNLVRAFNAAKQCDAVLFFDEADSFLGKRIQNVTQGAEQALNSLRSQMLMLLEQHSGVIIFATNMVTNFDSAFESRILKHIKFELPNKEARTVIIRNMMPPQLPWSENPKPVEIEELAEISDGFSGREIKGVVLETLLEKVSIDGEGARFHFTDFKNRFLHKKEEKKKLKEEADALLKQKITNALNRQAANSPRTTENSSGQDKSLNNSSETPQTNV